MMPIDCQKTKLLYRGSEMDFKFKEFIQSCNGLKHTVCLVMTDKNEVFGGYTDIEWRESKKPE